MPLSVDLLWPESKAPVEVTHAAFAILARRRGWTVDFLTEHFAGRFGDQKDPDQDRTSEATVATQGR